MAAGGIRIPAKPDAKKGAPLRAPRGMRMREEGYFFMASPEAAFCILISTFSVRPA